MAGESWTVSNENQAKLLSEYIVAQVQAGRIVTYSIEELSRSQQQNRAFWAMLTRLATALNDGGIEGPPHIFNPEWRQPWRKNLCKAVMFDPQIEIVYGKGSSSQLTVEEMSECVEYILAEVSRSFDIHVGGLAGPMGHF